MENYKYRIKNFVIIFLVGLNITSVIYYNHLKNKTILKNDLIKTRVISLENTLKYHIKNHNVIIEKDMLDSISIYKDKNNSYLLIYRFFKNNCEVCLMNDLELIKANLGKLINRNILILHYKPQSRYEKIYLNTLLRKFNHISIPDSNFNMGYNGGNKSHFFGIIDSTNRMKRIYFPQKGSQFITKQYLEDVSILFN